MGLLPGDNITLKSPETTIILTNQLGKLGTINCNTFWLCKNMTNTHKLSIVFPNIVHFDILLFKAKTVDTGKRNKIFECVLVICNVGRLTNYNTYPL